MGVMLEQMPPRLNVVSQYPQPGTKNNDVHLTQRQETRKPMMNSTMIGDIHIWLRVAVAHVDGLDCRTRLKPKPPWTSAMKAASKKQPQVLHEGEEATDSHFKIV